MKQPDSGVKSCVHIYKFNMLKMYAWKVRYMLIILWIYVHHDNRLYNIVI